jgi:hypothetical protein
VTNRAGVSLLLAALLVGCGGSWGGAHAAEHTRGPQLLPTRVRRLSNFEYERSASELVATPLHIAGELPPDVRQAGYTRNADQVIGAESLARLDVITRSVAREAVNARLSILAPCASTPDASCTTRVVETLGRRAFRHPLSATERGTLLTVFAAGAADGAGFAGGLELLLRVLLISPSFLYTTELGVGGAPGAVVTLDPYEIASELSYTVRSGPPDEALLAAAQSGALLSASERERQARRLIAESDTRYQFRRFVLEWLEVDALAQTAKASSVLPDYDDLKGHMLDETEAFVDEVMVHHGGSVQALLSAGFASVDPAMARFYGLHGYGPEASLSGSGRLGILQQASFLSAHSHEDSSSPVKRGDFVLRRLLCENVKRPGEVGVSIVFPPLATTRTTRERFALHTAVPECAGCHSSIDPIGFSFEEFDAAGRRRSSENGQRVDTTADFWRSGKEQRFADSRALSLALAADPQVSACFARQAFRYFSAGASPEAERAFMAIEQEAPQGQAGSLIEELLAFVKSELFVKRQVLP